MPVSRRLRFEILRRDGHTCRYCGASAPDVTLTVDHVIPVALGGGNEPNNLVTACRDCNAGKSSIAPDSQIVEDVDATALLFARAIEEARKRRWDELFDLRVSLDYLKGQWDGWRTNNGTGDPLPLPGDWRASITRFFEHGLTLHEIEMFMVDAMNMRTARDVFRVWCSKCWNEIGVRQELARRLIEDGEV